MLLYLLNKDFIKSKIINEKYKFIFSKKIKSIRSNTLYLWGSSWWEWFVDNHFYSQKEITGSWVIQTTINSLNPKKISHIMRFAILPKLLLKMAEWKLMNIKILIPIAKAFGEKLCKNASKIKS